MDTRRDSNGFTPQADVLRAIDERAPERTPGLETGDDHIAFTTPDVVFQMVLDPAATAHTASGDDDRAGVNPVQGHRLVRSWLPGCRAQRALSGRQGQNTGDTVRSAFFKVA